MNLQITLALAFIALALGGCRTRDESGGQVRANATPVDTNRAIEALNILGAVTPHLPAGSTGYCAGACHIGTTWHGSVLNHGGVAVIQDWAGMTDLMSKCLALSASAPAKRLACFYKDPTNAALGFNPQKLGFYRGAAHLKIIKDIFTDPALPAGVSGEAVYQNFLEAVAMPKQPPAPAAPTFKQMTKEEFETLETWSLAGAPGLEEAFGPVVVNPPPPTAVACTNDVSDALQKSIQALATSKKSWAEINKQNPNIKMLGCAQGVTAPDRCFMDPSNDRKFPEVFTDPDTADWASRIRNDELNAIAVDQNMPPTQRMRILRKLPFRGSYWARSSADGRYFANGIAEQAHTTNADGSTVQFVPSTSHGYIADLALPNRPFIGVTAPYDPGFFPDNNGFTWMQSGQGYFCSQRLLDNPATKYIDLSTEKTFCASRSMGVYQHVGRNPDSRYYVVRSDNYSNDNGGSALHADPSVSSFAKADAAAELFPMEEQGTSFAVKDPIKLAVPFEGDYGISPSAALISSRIASNPPAGGDSQQVGYRLRTFDFAKATTTPAATICMQGGKLSFSQDERFIVTHHYVNANDYKELGLAKDSAEFKARIATSSNVYIFDLLTKRKFRVTFMGPGQYALYPHFRADGWLYFLVRDMNKPTFDVAVASDVALRLPNLDASITGIP